MAPSTPRRSGPGTPSKQLGTPNSKLRGTLAKQGLTPKLAAKTGRTPTPARRRAALVADNDDDADSGSDVADYETADDGYEDAVDDSDDDDRSDEGSDRGDGEDDDGDAVSAASNSDADADEFVDARGSDDDEDDEDDEVDLDHDGEDSYDQGASGGSSGEESRSVRHESDHAGSSDDASAAALGEGCVGLLTLGLYFLLNLTSFDCDVELLAVQQPPPSEEEDQGHADAGAAGGIPGQDRAYGCGVHLACAAIHEAAKATAIALQVRRHRPDLSLPRRWAARYRKVRCAGKVLKGFEGVFLPLPYC